MEKTKEQSQNMCIAFVDLSKALDTVNRDFLFKILRKLGCPPKVVRLILKFILVSMLMES